MNIRVTELSQTEHAATMRHPLDFVTELGLKERVLKTIGSAVQIESTEMWFDDLHFLMLDLNPQQRITVKIETDESSCIMLFSLCGEINSRYPDGTQTALNFVCGQHNLIYTPGFEVLLDLKESTKVFFIHLAEPFIKRLIQEDFPLLADMEQNLLLKRMTTLGGNLQITPAMQTLISAIIQCNYTGYMKRIWLKSKVLELLFLQLDQYERSGQNDQYTFLKDYDIEKIHLAKTIIEQNLKSPCSLIELAHKAGLNDFKLKKGFKELLGTTVFGYLNDLRMDKAKYMLVKEKKTVNEVAHEIGYKNPHHFTVAFKKKFGLLPSQLNK